MGGGIVGGYIASVDGEQCVRSFDVFLTLHGLSKFSAGCFAPGGGVLAVDASGKEVADTCFCAGGWVHDRVCKMVWKEVCMVWVRLTRRENDEVACLVGWGHDGGDVRVWG